MPLNVNPIIAQLIAAQGANGAQPQSQGQGMGFKPAAQPQRRGGLLSRLRSVVTPERLQIFGATLRDIDTGGNSLDEVLQQIEAQRQQEIQNTWQDEGRLRQRMEWKQGDAQRAQQQQSFAQIRETLPENQRALFDANPQAFVSQRIEQTQPGQWQAGYGRAYRINPDGTTETGGSLPVAPRGSALSGPGWSDNAVDAAVSQMLVNGGRIPPNVRDSRAIARIWDAYGRRMDETGNTAGAQQARAAANRANSNALSDARTRRERAGSAERGMLDALHRARGLSDRVLRSGSPLLNVPINEWGTRASGNPDLAAFRAAALSAATEYARIIQGSGQATESLTREAQEMLSMHLTPQQFAAVQAVLEYDAHQRTARMLEEEQSLLSDIGEGTVSASPEWTPTDAPPPVTGARSRNLAPGEYDPFTGQPRRPAQSGAPPPPRVIQYDSRGRRVQ